MCRIGEINFGNYLSTRGLPISLSETPIHSPPTLMVSLSHPPILRQFLFRITRNLQTLLQKPGILVLVRRLRRSNTLPASTPLLIKSSPTINEFGTECGCVRGNIDHPTSQTHETNPIFFIWDGPGVSRRQRLSVSECSFIVLYLYWG